MMDCDEVRERLVALHDDELSPSEVLQVREHVARCASCTGTERALVDFRPTPPQWGPPDEVRDRLARALDPDLLFALAEQPIPAPPAPKRDLWPAARRTASVPLGAVVMYVVLLVGSFAWGASNWWTLNSRDSLPEQGIAGAVGAPPGGAAIVAPDALGGTAIPADQFRPAAWDPSAEAGGR